MSEDLSATALKKRRKDLDCTQTDVATELAQQDEDEGYFGVARGTISHYVSEWERGDREPSDEDLEKYEAALDAIEERRNEPVPDCSNPECNTTSEFKRVETPDGPLCQVCYYSREVEPLNSVDYGYGGGA